MSDGRNQRNIFYYSYYIGFNRVFYAFEYTFEFIVRKSAAFNHERHSIDTRRNMFDRHTLLFDYRKYFSYETDFGVHKRFFYEYYSKILFARNTRNRAAARNVSRSGNNRRSLVFGTERIFYLYGDIRFAHGKNRFAVKNVRAHIAEFPELFVGKLSYALGTVYYPRVAGEKA